MNKLHWRILPLILFSLIVIFFWRGLSLDPHHLPSAHVGKLLPPFQLITIDDEEKLFTPADMHGQIALLNIWASWCAACTQEQVFLMKLAREGVGIYGLNYKDDLVRAKQWLKEWGNPYKIIGEDVTGKVAIDLGVYGAPETFLIDQKGVIRYRHVGILTMAAWEQEFLPIIERLEHLN